jgi:uncharacterized membrane protein YtjA (UPF0391 family)
MGRGPERPPPQPVDRRGRIWRRDKFERNRTMLGWAIVFAVLALIAGYLGFMSLAGVAATIAKVLFLVFLVLLVVSFIIRAVRGQSVV